MAFIEATRKYQRPTKEELAALIAEHQTTSAAAKAFGCSRATIQRWAWQLDLYFPANKWMVTERGGMLSKSIPTSVLGPILQKLIDNHEISPLMGGDNTKANSFRGGKLTTLFPDDMPEQYRVPSRTVFAILTQERKGVKLQTADKILCWLDANYLWHRPPLNTYYWEGKPIPEGLDAIVEGLVQMHSKAQAA